MKYLAFYLSLYFFRLVYPSEDLYSARTTQEDIDFRLSYNAVGMGSNMFTRQPVFRVNGTKFIYTSEEAWHHKDYPKAKPDTILIGDFRLSSIDSILNLVKDIKDSVVRRFNPNIMSGGIDYINILSSHKNIRFELDNESDLIAEKIIDILNSYISTQQQKIRLAGIS
jgi:hypothetical protein